MGLLRRHRPGDREGASLSDAGSATLETEALARFLPGALVFDAERGSVVERRRELLHDLALDQRIVTDVDRAAAGEMLDRDAPERFALPVGRSVAIRYPAERLPIAAAGLQDLFGVARMPRLARGRVPLVLEILSPGRRPVQVTDDLAS